MKFATLKKEFSCADIIDDLPIAFFLKDLEHRILGCNQAFLDLVGKTREEVMEHKMPDVLPDDFECDWQKSNDVVLSGRGTQEFEVVMNRAEESPSYWTVRKSCVTNDEGVVVGVVGSVVDITKIKEAQMTQQKEHQLLRTVIDILPAFIYAKDEESRFMMANQVVAGFMGCSSPDELIGKTDFDFLPYKFAMKYYCDEQEIIVSGRPLLKAEESVATEENSTPMWLSTNKVPLRDQEGNIIGIVGSGVDITQQKLTNDRLRELQEIVNHSTSCAFLLSTFDNWNVRFCSETVSLFGYEPPDFTKDGLNFLEIVHPEDIGRIEQETLENFANGQTMFTQEFRIRTKSEGYCWVEDQKFLREIMDDGTYVFQSLITDISVRHKYQEERDEMEIQLRQAQKLEAVGQLAAGIAHEINTPIQFINDNLQFLSDSTRDLHRFIRQVFDELKAPDETTRKLHEKLTALAKEYDLDFIVEEVPAAISQSVEGAHRVRDIVQAMKEFSHPGNGEIRPEDINKAIQNTITIARNEWKYISDIETHLDPDVVAVPVDIGPFKQTILNLIVNAAHTIEERVKKGDFSKGTITISTKLEGDHVVISIQDTGMGIPEKIAQRIFDPFFTTKEVGKGTGQGLSMAYDIIVRKHQGKLYFDTVPGEGTTFYIELLLDQDSEE